MCNPEQLPKHDKVLILPLTKTGKTKKKKIKEQRIKFWINLPWNHLESQAIWGLRLKSKNIIKVGEVRKRDDSSFKSVLRVLKSKIKIKKRKGR